VRAVISGGAGSDTFTFSGSGSLSGAVTGGTGADTLAAIEGSNSTWMFSGTDSGSVELTDGATYVADFTGIESFVSGNGADTANFSGTTSATSVSVVDYTGFTRFVGNAVDTTFVGSNDGDAWSITGDGDGTLNTTIAFEDMQSLTGGTGADSFTFSGSGSIAGTVTGGTGTDTINANNLANEWDIDGENSGKLYEDDNADGFTSSNQYASFIGIEEVTGGTGNDTFTFSGSGSLSGSVTGGTGADTLAAIEGNNSTWMFSGTDSGSVELTDGATYVADFTGIESFVSGNGADTANFSGTTSATSVSVVDYTGFTRFVGNAVDTTFVGSNDGDVWSITGDGDGTLNTTIAFEDMQSLTGGTGADSFTFSGSGSIAGTVAGGDGTDTLEALDGNDSTWMFSHADSGSVELTDGATYVAGFTGIESFVSGNDTDTANFSGTTSVTSVSVGDYTGFTNFVGNAVNTTFVGRNGGDAWSITGGGDGKLNDSITFTDMYNLEGGTGNDTFTFSGAGSIAGMVTGGDGSDTVVANNTANEWALDGENSGKLYEDDNANGFTGNNQYASFTGIENVTGGLLSDTFVLVDDVILSGLIDGAEGDNTLIATNDTNIWSISGTDEGDVTDSKGSEIRFTRIDNLTGGSGKDTFNLDEMDDITGLIDGAVGKSDTLNLSGSGQTISLISDINNVEVVSATGDNNTLEATNDANTWDITSENAGGVTATTLGQTVTFTNIANLTGGTGNDTFELSAMDDISGLIDGSDGETDKLILTNSNQVISLISDINNVEYVVASGSGNSLQATNDTNTWNITGTDNGNVTAASTGQKVSFTNVSNLTGGSRKDTFNLDEMGDITGLIDGAAGDSDTLSLSESGQTISLISDINNVEVVSATGDNNTLEATNSTNTWAITSENAGSVTANTSGQKVSFTNVANLTGGTGNDTFNLSEMGDITGLIDGNENVTDSDTDTLALSTAGQTISLISDINNVEVVSATGDNNTLEATNYENTWDITGENVGSVTANTSGQSVSFSSIANLTGGDSSDTFNIQHTGAVSGIIKGEGDADTLNVYLGDATEDSIVTFDGGELDNVNDVINVVTAKDTTSVFSEEYFTSVDETTTYENLSFSSDTGNDQQVLNVKFTNVGTVNDLAKTTSFMINSDDADLVTLSGLIESMVTIEDALYTTDGSALLSDASTSINFNIADKGDFVVDAINSDLDFAGDFEIDGSLSVTANQVTSTTGGTITADELTLMDVASVWSTNENNALDINVDALSIHNFSGNVYLDESDSLTLNTLADTAGGYLVLNANGDINSIASSSLISSADINLSSQTGDISLADGTIQLSGTLNLAADTATLDNQTSTTLDVVDVKSLTVTSDGDVTSLTNFDATDASITSTQGSVSLEGDTTISALTIVAAQNVTLTSANNDFSTLAVTATTAEVTDKNGLDKVSATLQDSFTLNANGDVMVADIKAANNITINAGSGAIKAYTTTSESTNSLTGDIVEVIENHSNLVADSVTLTATNGIGEGSYSEYVAYAAVETGYTDEPVDEPDTTGVINTSTAHLSAINNNVDTYTAEGELEVTSSSAGVINISNNNPDDTASLLINDLRNDGDIIFTNVGDVTLDNSTNENGTTVGAITANYLRDDTNAEYSGDVAILMEEDNSLYTTSQDFNLADVVAENFWVSDLLLFGGIANYMTVRVNEQMVIYSKRSFLVYDGAAPRDPFISGEFSIFDLSNTSGLELVDINTLDEVDSAIFSDVRNYNNDDVSVLLPADQLLDDEDEEDDDEDEENFSYVVQ